MLHDMIMEKFKLEANYSLNLSAKMPSFDDIFDITDDNENNDSRHKNESYFEKPESSFGFGDYNEYGDKQNDFDNVVHENPQPNYHKWEKFMSFNPDILETSLYKSKPMISKEYKKETEVKVGNIFDNKEALVLAIRMKALDKGYQFLSERSNPNRLFTPDGTTSSLDVDPRDGHERIAASTETYRAMVQEWYFKRRELADNMTSEIIEYVANKTGDIIEKSTFRQALVNVVNGSFPSFLVALRFAVTRLWRYDEIVYQLYQIGFKDDKYQGNY
ncbi:hypothetical protein Tco_0625339 [Tanacetum coccineum]|uniref:Uncharacterized protein n=1 Tax=Tanacetum coccineum TaxID=301880 RepID=A0ABQ4WGI7_9ASTR